MASETKATLVQKRRRKEEEKKKKITDREINKDEGIIYIIYSLDVIFNYATNATCRFKI